MTDVQDSTNTKLERKREWVDPSNRITSFTMTFLMGGLLGIMIGMNNVTQVVPYVRLFWIIPLVVGVMTLAKFVKWRQNTESLLTLKIWTFTTVEMLLFNVSIAILSGVYNINTMPLS